MFYIGYYLYDLTNQYLTIENGTIRKNGLYGLGKKLNLDEINWIKKFAGDYTLKTKKGDLKINTELIDKDSLYELNKILAGLNCHPKKRHLLTIFNLNFGRLDYAVPNSTIGIANVSTKPKKMRTLTHN